VWYKNSTYVREAHGSVYRVAVVEWSSRHVLFWERSTTLNRGFCVEAVGF